MIIVRIGSHDEAGCCRIERSLYLASILRKRLPFIFCIDKDKALEKLLDERKFDYFHPSTFPQNIEHQANAIIFDVSTFGPVEEECLRRAQQAGIPAIQFTDTETGIDNHLVHKKIPGTSDSVDYYSLGSSRYALLHHKYRHFNKVNRKYRKKIKYLFIDLAGALEYRRYRDIIDCLSRQGFRMKIGPDSKLKKSYRKILKRIYPQVRFTGEVESLARPIFEADLAIILPGFPAYRAAATGTPAVYLCCNNEQLNVGQSLVKARAGICGSIDHLDDLVARIKQLSVDRRIAMGAAGKNWVDGKGIYRVIDFLIEKGII